MSEPQRASFKSVVSITALLIAVATQAIAQTAEPPSVTAPAPAVAAPAPAVAPPAEPPPPPAPTPEPVPAPVPAAATTVVVAEEAEISMSDIETDTEMGAAATTSNGLPWMLANRRYSTLEGGTGGLHLIDPTGGVAGAMRIQLGLSLFDKEDWLIKGDEVQHSAQSITASWTPVEFFEVWAALQNRGTANNAPSSLHSLGDTFFGFKFQGEATPVVGLGGDLRIRLMSDTGSSANTLSATSIGLRGAVGFDLQKMPQPVPIIGRFNVGYLFDNSAKLIEQTEEDQYERLNNPLPEEDDSRHLVSRFERVSLDINRVDMFSIGFGVEIPAELADETYLHPMLELDLGIPVNRQDYDCGFFGTDRDRGTNKSADDACLFDDEGKAAWPVTTVSLGVRFVPPLRGLTTLIGIDLTLVGDDLFVRELAPQPPFMFHFALGYDYDAKPIEPIYIVEKAEPPPPPPVKGRIVGVIADRTTGAGIDAARVAFVGSPYSAMSTSTEGAFTSYQFDPGPADIQVTHPGYTEATCGALIPEQGGDVELRCELDPIPPPLATLVGSVVDSYGTPLGGVGVRLSGPATGDVSSDVDGNFEFTDLEPGEYTLRPDSDSHLRRIGRVVVESGGRHSTTLSLAPKPAKSGIIRRGDKILIRGLKFDSEETAPTTASLPLVAELADLLLRAPEIRRIRLQAPGSDSMSLTRGLLLKQRLVSAGVADGRIESIGGGGRNLAITIVDQ